MCSLLFISPLLLGVGAVCHIYFVIHFFSLLIIIPHDYYHFSFMPCNSSIKSKNTIVSACKNSSHNSVNATPSAPPSPSSFSSVTPPNFSPMKLPRDVNLAHSKMEPILAVLDMPFLRHLFVTSRKWSCMRLPSPSANSPVLNHKSCPPQ